MEPVIDFDVIDDHGAQTYEAQLTLSNDEIARAELAGPASAHIQARADRGDVAGEYEVEGNLTFTADLACSRCTDPYPFASESGFTVRYRPLTEASGLAPDAEVPADDLDVEYTEERSVPLRQVAIEQIQLAFPMKPLCEDACRGLCASCGANLNRESCSCEPAAIDPRWEGLSALREQLDKKKQN